MCEATEIMVIVITKFMVGMNKTVIGLAFFAHIRILIYIR